MIYQLIYGKHPSLGYRELKYSAGIMTDEYLDNSLLDAFKVRFGLSDNEFEAEPELPTCIYFISSDINGKCVCTIGNVSLELRNGENTNLSHFYIFTSNDVYGAVAANTQSSVFNLKSFVQTFGKASSYDIDSSKIFNADNTFSIQHIKGSMESVGIDKNLFKVILHKLFLAVQSNKRIFIASSGNISEFSKSALSLIRGIFYVFPNDFLSNFGFITYLRHISDSDKLHEYVQVAVIDNNDENRAEYAKEIEKGNFIIDCSNYSGSDDCDIGLLLELMASIIYNFSDRDILTGFYSHSKKYLKESSYRDYTLCELLYKHYAAFVAKTEDFSVKDIYNSLLEHADKLDESIFQEVSIEVIEALKESIENVSLESEKQSGLEKIFVKLKTLSNYSVEMYTDENFLIFLQNKLMHAFDYADYSLLKYYHTLSLNLESNVVDETSAGNLKKIREEIINGTFSKVKSHEITIEDKSLLESWTEEQISLLYETNKKKIFDVLIGKSLESSLHDPTVFNKLLVDFKNEIKASGYLQLKISHYKDEIVSLYKSCVDAKEIRIYFQNFAIIFENNTELFKIIFDKDGLYELLLYIKILEDNSSSEDLNFIGEVLENFNSSKMKKDVRAFFMDEKYKYELEKAARIDKNIDMFAKRYKIFDTGKKGWFSKG